MKPASSIAVILVSKGRPAILKDTLAGIPRQTLKPSQIIVVVTCDDDFPPQDRPNFVEVYLAQASICRQRNEGIRRVAPGTDYVAFFDDDFELKADFLENAVTFLNDVPSVAALSGDVVRDGDITREEARQVVATHQWVETYKGNFIREVKDSILYGCCMVMRRVLFEYERFDDNLPLYAFGEDYDITIRLKRYGYVGRYKRCIGVHLCTPSGRVNEVRRGYSMVANNWYFLQNGVSHLPPRMALLRFWLVIVIRQILQAAWRTLKGDKTSDWKGRTRGLVMGVMDIARGRSSPQRILEIP